MATKRVHNANVTWTPHIQLSWGGHLGTTREVWTNGMRWVYNVETIQPGALALNAMLQVLKTATTAWMTSTGASGGANPLGDSHISSDVYLTWVKANYILATGLQADTNTYVLDFDPVPGHANMVPYYQTWAVTFRTAIKRGRSHSGRIYPPVVNIPIQHDTGLGDPAACADLNRSTQVLINSLNANLSTAGDSSPGAVSILSPGNLEKGLPALAQKVTGVTVDQVPDVQHRRTNRLTRSEVPLYPIA